MAQRGQKADTSNAHVRKDSKRESPEVIANDAKRLLDDPAFVRGVELVRQGLLRELEQLKHDGSPEHEDFEREVCRSLRSLKSVRHAITACVQGQTLREAGFKPIEPEAQED
jgi:hypothetical protein